MDYQAGEGSEWPHPVGPVGDLAYLCDCCGDQTAMRLKEVPLCGPCMGNLVEARSRELKNGKALPATAFPQLGVKCAKRGHRPAKAKRKTKAQQLALDTSATIDSEGS